MRPLILVSLPSPSSSFLSPLHSPCLSNSRTQQTADTVSNIRFHFICMTINQPAPSNADHRCFAAKVHDPPNNYQRLQQRPPLSCRLWIFMKLPSGGKSLPRPPPPSHQSDFSPFPLRDRPYPASDVIVTGSFDGVNLYHRLLTIFNTQPKPSLSLFSSGPALFISLELPLVSSKAALKSHGARRFLTSISSTEDGQRQITNQLN